MQYVHALHDGLIIQRHSSTQLYFTCQGDTLANANGTSLFPQQPLQKTFFFASRFTWYWLRWILIKCVINLCHISSVTGSVWKKNLCMSAVSMFMLTIHCLLLQKLYTHIYGNILFECVLVTHAICTYHSNNVVHNDLNLNITLNLY